MPYPNTEIQQAIANVDSKLSLRSYSGFLRDLYGMAKTNCLHIEKLLLLRFVLYKWDNRVGGANIITEAQLTNVIRQVNQL